MNSTPIVAARLLRDTRGSPEVPAYQDRADPAQVDTTFLAGSDLPARWQGRQRFVVLSVGFGAGHGFLATWRAWRGATARPERLVFIAIEPHPLKRADLHALHGEADDDAALCGAWPALTHNLHRLVFDEGRVQLLLAFGPVRGWLPELVADVDAFYLDGMGDDGDTRRCKALGRIAAAGATLAAHRPAPNLGSDLRSAGFVTTQTPADALCARFAPAFTPRRAPARLPRAAGSDRHALIVGAGLAGCATACALAEQGWRSTLLERRDRPAAEASGNPAGLFHGIVNAQDGVHARFNRAAAMRTVQEMNMALQDGVPGARDGLLRMASDLPVEAMHRMLASLGLPTDHVRAVSAAEASALAGRSVPTPAWFYPDGGWVDPAALAAHWLRRAGPAADWRAGVRVHSIRRQGTTWRLLDEGGEPLAESATVILANACDALRLIGAPDWPIDMIRGQVSLTSAPPFALPQIPIAGSGYLLPALGDLAMFGATAQARDLDPSVRQSDHDVNLRQLDRLLGHPSGLQAAGLRGRTAWRCSALDRLPLIGAVPDLPPAAGSRRDVARLMARRPGLYMISGLGSRGIAWSMLGAQVLAAGIAGAPVPLEASLLDAIDPARFISRQARLAAA